MCLSSLAAVACEGSESPGVGNGALGDGSFVYSCVSASDSACSGHVGDAPTIPGSTSGGVAVGASFAMRFEPARGEPSAALDVASPDFFDLGSDGVLRAKRPGYGAVLARAGSGDVVDYVNVRLHLIASLRVAGVDAATTLKPGDTRAVVASPLDESGEALAGTLVYDWETSDAGVVAVSISDADRALGGATLRAVAPGTARIRVVVNGVTAIVDVLVGSA